MPKLVRKFLLSVMREFLYRKKFKSLISQKCDLTNGSSARFVLFGSPEYNNLGDHAIAFAILTFLRSSFPNVEIIEIPESKILNDFGQVKDALFATDIICLVGGGNFGNEYMDQRTVRNLAMSYFETNPIIIFPQSIFYTKSIMGKIALKHDRKIIKKSKNTYVFTRDRLSFEYLKSNFKGCNALCTPDIVLSLADYIEFPEVTRKEVLFCIRNDVESRLSSEDKALLKKHFTTYREKDTCLPYEISISQRSEEINNFLLELTKCKLVITDRLHGAIFCAITKTPCIIFNNYNHKIKGIAEWLKNCSYVFLCDSVSSFDKILSEIDTTESENSTPTWKSHFAPLKDVLSKLVNDMENI